MSLYPASITLPVKYFLLLLCLPALIVGCERVENRSSSKKTAVAVIKCPHSEGVERKSRLYTNKIGDTIFYETAAGRENVLYVSKRRLIKRFIPACNNEWLVISTISRDADSGSDNEYYDLIYVPEVSLVPTDMVRDPVGFKMTAVGLVVETKGGETMTISELKNRRARFRPLRDSDE
ncbi:MAG: hypothetical protein OEZ39_07725 [Gammaproteobacteria bacterium]|nr:hypothetical protein [Gammaproteobacteria bacterium]MDH5651748.1 hypothetical protein [Gammaproteobacteria bacterium]